MIGLIFDECKNVDVETFKNEVSMFAAQKGAAIDYAIGKRYNPPKRNPMAGTFGDKTPLIDKVFTPKNVRIAEMQLTEQAGVGHFAVLNYNR